LLRLKSSYTLSPLREESSYKVSSQQSLWQLKHSEPILSTSSTPSFLLRTFTELISFGVRVVWAWFSSSLNRFTYYFAWLLAEGACILSGFGYNGKNKDGSLKWDRASSVRPVKVELAPSFKDITENWNLSADKWLRCCTSER